MRKINVLTLVMAAVLAAVLGAAQRDAGAAARLQAAINKETVEGDLKAAIDLYQKLAESPDRAVAAQALVRMGQCQEKLGNAKARQAYERAIRDFADQTGPVATARARLAALGQPAGGALTVRRAWTMDVAWNLGPVSLDGRYHAYSRGNTGPLLVRDIATGDVGRIERVSDGDGVYEAVISPDNKWIAYGGQPGWGLQELLVVGMDGTPPKSVFKTNVNNDVSWVIPSGWTPDGKEVLVTFNRQGNSPYHVGMISVETGTLRVLREFEFGSEGVPSISPDGKWVAYTAQTSPDQVECDIHVVRSDGSGDHKLVDHPADDIDPYWTPDGRGLVFRSNRRGSIDAWFVPVNNGTVAGPAVMIKDNVPSFLLGVTRQGTLYYQADAGITEIRALNLDQATGRAPGKAEALPLAYTGDIRSAVLSPGGDWLAYVRPSANRPRMRIVVLRSMASGEERELDPPIKALNSVSWYPDGKSLLAYGRDMRDHHSTWKIDIATGATRLLYRRNEFRPLNTIFRAGFVAPDGRTVYLRGAYDTDAAIVALNTETKERREVFRREGIRINNRRPVASPDGRYVAVTFREQGDDPRTGLLVADTHTGESRELGTTHGQTEVAGWTPDSRHVVIVTAGEADRDQVEVWRVPLDGGDIVKSGLPARYSDGFEIVPQRNGNRLVWTTGTAKPEIWAVDNVLPAPGAEAQ